MPVELLACSRFRDHLGVTFLGEAMKHAVQSVIAACVLASVSPAAAQIKEFTYSFIPIGGSNIIRFSEIGGGGYYAGLDDIGVAAVPEPSTWALALLGFAALGVLGMRRRRLAPA
jgi:hypothetical protein